MWGLGFFRGIPYDLVFKGVILSYSLIFDFIMSSSNSSEDKKSVSGPEVVPMMSKMTEDKLTGPNYSD